MRRFEVSKNFTEQDVHLPTRGTEHSAGYDFEVLVSEPAHTYMIKPGQTHTFHTGVKCHLNPDEVLTIYPRSSTGFKKHLMLCNSVGIIDADYYSNEKTDGEIMVGLYNYGNEPVIIKDRDVLVQGIISKYLVTDDDHLTEKAKRTGGIGSTDGNR